jgi:hypothetical protein
MVRVCETTEAGRGLQTPSRGVEEGGIPTVSGGMTLCASTAHGRLIMEAMRRPLIF